MDALVDPQLAALYERMHQEEAAKRLLLHQIQHGATIEDSERAGRVALWLFRGAT